MKADVEYCFNGIIQIGNFAMAGPALTRYSEKEKDFHCFT